MRGIHYLFTLAVVAFSQVASESLTAKIRMDGVKAELQCNPKTSGMDCALIYPSGFPTGDVKVNFHPAWMDYNVADKCTLNQLGNAETGSQSLNSQSSTFTLSSTSISDLEGKSVSLTAEGKTSCAALWRDGRYLTADAVFEGVVSGSVYFREYHGDNTPTRLVSQLASDATFGDPAWKIVDEMSDCTNASQIPAGDDLTAKFGAPKIQSAADRGGSARSSSGVTLDGSGGIANKFLVIYDKANSSIFACAKIRLFREMKATALFSQDGIHGKISFAQASPFDVTHTMVMLEGLKKGAKGYHIHEYPTPAPEVKDQEVCSSIMVAGHFNPFNIASFPAPAAGTDDQYEIGDFSSKYGTLSGLDAQFRNYTDRNLPLFGKRSIVGRSIVIHRDNVANGRWVCSNIELEGSVLSGVAVFNYPIIGRIYFTHSVDPAFTDTWIFADLAFLDDRVQSDGHHWYIADNKAGADKLAASDSRCESTGAKYKLGDMTKRHGGISIGSNYKAKAYFADLMLTLSGMDSVFGKSVVIMNKNGDTKLACATINKLHAPNLKADLDSGGISGSVSFTQQPGFGRRPTKVSVKLTGFDKQNHKLRILSLPPVDGDCSDLGNVYNPLDYSTSSNGVTNDMWMLGDLTRGLGDISKGVTEWEDLNLPLERLISIRHRSLAVLNNEMKVVACGIIQEPFSRSYGGYQVAARAVFGNPLSGSIDLFQTLYSDGSKSDTSVLVNLRNADRSKTENHKWHTHETPVKGDAAASTGRCTSTGPHYDPFKASWDDAAAGYAMHCTETNPLRCELGDQSKKLGAYSVGYGRKVYTDVDLPLDGMYNVQGRSFVVHLKDMGGGRLACADIYPVSVVYHAVEVEFDTPQTLDLSDAKKLYATATKVDANEIVLELLSTSPELTKVRIHFIGLERELNRGKFLAYFGDADKRKSFGKYAPKTDPNKAGCVAMSTALLMLMVLISYVVYQ